MTLSWYGFGRVEGAPTIMAKGILHKLSPRKAATISGPGRHSDGGNLYLSITKTGTRSWSFFYRSPSGRRREMGLGSAMPGGITLADARTKAQTARDMLAHGVDPLDHKRQVKAAKPAESPMFLPFARDHVRDKSPTWSTSWRRNWISAVETHCRPLHGLRLADIGTDDILAVMRPLIESGRGCTAGQTRSKLETLRAGYLAAPHEGTVVKLEKRKA